MARQLQFNWSAIVEEAIARRKQQNITQQRLALLAGVSTPTISSFENGATNIELASVLKIIAQLGMLDKHELVFEGGKAVYSFDRSAILFFGMDGDKKISCAISQEALEDHFALKPQQNPLKVFLNNRQAIWHEARRKYLAQQFEKDGSILVRSGDL